MALALRAPVPAVIVVAILVFGVTFVAHSRYGRTRVGRLQSAVRPVFPTRPAG